MLIKKTNIWNGIESSEECCIDKMPFQIMNVNM